MRTALLPVSITGVIHIIIIPQSARLVLATATAVCPSVG
ncbi:Hypothetical protein Cp262_2218 [Corynebacterium pseudotuberculosis]|nr:Hypothetical protein Cp262_2218 [Corynebacterium pseudotuberculosis]